MPPSSSTNTTNPPRRPDRSPESFDSLYRRNQAAEILQSYEVLSWYSMQRCESLAQTRLHFQNIVAGFTEDDEAALVDWVEDRSPRVEEAERKKGKERERVSSAHAVGQAGPSSAGKASSSKRKSAGSGGP